LAYAGSRWAKNLFTIAHQKAADELVGGNGDFPHVLPRGFVRIRSFGFLAKRRRKLPRPSSQLIARRGRARSATEPC
jgi:hypothetical protein